jgi:hypothetical protein
MDELEVGQLFAVKLPMLEQKSSRRVSRLEIRNLAELPCGLVLFHLNLVLCKSPLR